MSNIDIGNEFSFGLGLTADEVEQLPKFNLARGKIIPIQLEQPFTESWDSNNNPNASDPNYNLKIINYPTPFFIIASSKVYNINKVNSMSYNDPRNGKNSDTTTVLQYTVVQGDETNYPQNIYTESATLGAGGNGQLPRNFYFTPFQGQITQSMVPVYLLPINTKVKGNVSTSEGSNTYLYTFVRADIFITIPSTLSSGVGSGFSYIDYLNNPQNYQSLTNPKDLPNYNNLPPTLGNGGTDPIISVKNLVFLATNYIGNQSSVNTYSSFNRFLTYDDMYSITSKGNNFVNGNTAGPVFFGLEDLQSNGTISAVPPIIPFTNPASTFSSPPYGNNSIPPYYIFSGRPYSIFFGLHLNTNTFKPNDAIYGENFNNYAKNTDNITIPNIQLPDNAKGYPVNFLTSLGNNNPTNGAPNITSNNTSYQKVYNINSNDTQSFFQSDSSNYIGSTYAMDEYYISNTRTTPKYGLTGASSFFNIYKFSLNKYIRFYSGTDGYEPMVIPYNTSFTCSYNGGDYNGYNNNISSNNYDLLNCNTTQVGLVQNMTLQFVPLNYFIPPPLNVAPNVTDKSLIEPLSVYIPPANTSNYYINNSSAVLTYDSTDPNLKSYTQIKYQLVGGGGGGGGYYLGGGGGGGSGQIVGFIGGSDTPSGGTTSFVYSSPPAGYPQLNVIEQKAALPPIWKITVTIGNGGTGGTTTAGDNGGNTILTVYDNTIPSSPVVAYTIVAQGGNGGGIGYPIGGGDLRDGTGGNGFNGGGGGSDSTQGVGQENGLGGRGNINAGGQNGFNGYTLNNGGNGGGYKGGQGGDGSTSSGSYTAGGGGGAGAAVIVNISGIPIDSGGTGTRDGGLPSADINGIDYTGGGGGGGSSDLNGPTNIGGGNGGCGYAILQFTDPIDWGFSYPDPDNEEKKYLSTLPTSNATNVIAPQDLFKTISSLYANNSSVVCDKNLSSGSKCGFTSPEFYNSLLKNFYNEDPNVLPICGDVYDPPIVVGQTSLSTHDLNIYNSISCGAYTGAKQNLCVPNFEHLSDKSLSPFKCVPIPLPDDGDNFKYNYESYYGMYEEDTSVTPSVPVNKNFPNYFNQTPNKNVTLTIPSYTPVPYPKPANVPGSTKEKTFWNSTAFIIIAIIIGVAILITIIIIVVKFSKSPNKYEKVRYKYNS